MGKAQEGRVESSHSGWASVFSTFSGLAQNVVQGRDISGGVHFHGAARPEIVVPRQLPADVRGFVGREDDLRRLHAAVAPAAAEPTSVLVLAGAPGVGKSALAVRFADQVCARFGDGQLFVNLHGYDAARPLDPAAVLGRFLRALGVASHRVPVELEERAALYRSLLAERRVLVVLDNAADTEHPGRISVPCAPRLCSTSRSSPRPT